MLRSIRESLTVWRQPPGNTGTSSKAGGQDKKTHTHTHTHTHQLICGFLRLRLPHSQCERNPCPMEESRSCHLAAKTVSFHYRLLPSGLQTPATLFQRRAQQCCPTRPAPPL